MTKETRPEGNKPSDQTAAGAATNEPKTLKADTNDAELQKRAKAQAEKDQYEDG